VKDLARVLLRGANLKCKVETGGSKGSKVRCHAHAEGRMSWLAAPLSIQLAGPNPVARFTVYSSFFVLATRHLFFRDALFFVCSLFFPCPGP